MTAKPILDGVTILDLTQFIAGPVATRLLAEMGADVIKVELAPDGDQCRALPVIKDGRSAYFAQQNQGKRGVAKRSWPRLQDRYALSIAWIGCATG